MPCVVQKIKHLTHVLINSKCAPRVIRRQDGRPPKAYRILCVRVPRACERRVRTATARRKCRFVAAFAAYVQRKSRARVEFHE